MMSKTAEDAALFPVDIDESVKSSEETTSEESQVLTDKYSLNPISEDVPSLSNDSLSSVNSTTNTTDKVQEDSSSDGSCDALDQEPYLQKRKRGTIDDVKNESIYDGEETELLVFSNKMSTTKITNFFDVYPGSLSSSTTTSAEASPTNEDISGPESEELSADEKLRTSINELPSSDESSRRSSSHTKWEDMDDFPKSEGSITDESSNTECSKSYLLKLYHSSSESDLSEQENSNQHHHFRKRKLFTIDEEKESSDSDKDLPSSDNTDEELVGLIEKNKHSGIRRTSSDYFPLTAEDSLKSGDSSEESRDESLDSESCVPFKNNAKQILPKRKRKQTIPEAMGDADNEADSSNDDSQSSKKAKNA